MLPPNGKTARSMCWPPMWRTRASRSPMPTTPKPTELSATSPSVDVLVCVDPAQVSAIWPQAKLLLTTAYLHHPVDDTIEAIEADVRSGASLLWIVWGRGIIAAATTKIMQTPTHKVLR